SRRRHTRFSRDWSSDVCSSDLVLSERVRARDLFAFADIPAALIDTNRTERDEVRYYTETPSYTSLPDWLRATVEREAAIRRFERSEERRVGKERRPRRRRGQ